MYHQYIYMKYKSVNQWNLLKDALIDKVMIGVEKQ